VAGVHGSKEKEFPLYASSSLHRGFTLLSYVLKYEVGAYLIPLTPNLVGAPMVVPHRRCPARFSSSLRK
jgi:hypothetical protein